MHDKNRVIGFKNRSIKSSKRALLAYLPEHVSRYLNGEKIIRFSNNGIAIGWATVLADMGYEVDVVNWDDLDVSLENSYDIFIPHGAVNFKKIYQQLSKKAKIIHFSTGSYWRFHNKQEERRIQGIYKRDGVLMQRDRYLNSSDDIVYKKSDAVISIGGKKIKNTYSYKNVYTINNACYQDNKLINYKKNYKNKNNNFLYFAGAGNIHKGLDLLIEAFSDLDQNLYIMCHLDRDFTNHYNGLLQLPNIKIIGEVVMRNKDYYQGMKECSFCILPSCSEGQPGSVIEAMSHGLIPIVSKECFIDTKNFGYTLKECSIEEIRRTVKRLSSLDSQEIFSYSARTQKEVNLHYRPDNFRVNLRNVLNKILNNNSPKPLKDN